MPSHSSSRSTSSNHLFPSPRETSPESCLIAHIDGGARGNPGPAGYGVFIKDQAGRKIAGLSQYLGHQTNNFAEYQGLIAALEYALQHGPKAIKVISDSELMVRQIKGIYKVKNATLKDLHGRAQELIAQLDWFSIQHVLRESNREADELANAAMDKGMGRPGADRAGADRTGADRAAAGNSSTSLSASSPPHSPSAASEEFEGVVIHGGLIRLRDGQLPEGTPVQIRVKKMG